MNNLILRESKVTIVGVKEYADAVKANLETIGIIAPTTDNVSDCAKKVTEYRKEIKDAESAVKSVYDTIEAPAKEQLKPLTDAIAEAKGKSNQYQKDVLAVKKEAYKGKAKKEYDSIVASMLAGGDVSGEIPQFESIYSDFMYNMVSTQLHDSLLLKIKTALEESKINDNPSKKCALMITGSKHIYDAEKLLKDSGIDFEEVPM